MKSELGLLWHETGTMTYSGVALALARRLDALMLSWAAPWLAEDHEFPPLLSVKDLARVDYLSSFHHLATFPVTLQRSESGLSSFAERNAGARDAVDLGPLEPARAILTPAACYHVYVDARGSQLNAARYVTTRAACFRREASYTPLERQYSFSMREIVCLGSADAVQAFLGTMRDRLQGLFASWGWPVTFEAATDPFFGGAAHPKSVAQRIDPVKHEMVFQGRLALGSINFHRNYFGEAYDITHRGVAAFSGCVAFGIDRWLAALFAQYGQEVERFPKIFQPVRSP